MYIIYHSLLLSSMLGKGKCCQIKILDKGRSACYNTAGIKQYGLTGGAAMEDAELILLYDYYGDLLTTRQKEV